MDWVEQSFLEMQEPQHLLQVKCIDIFLIKMHGKEELKRFLEKFNNMALNLKFTCKSSERSISFLDPMVALSEGKLKIVYGQKPKIVISSCITTRKY